MDVLDFDDVTVWVPPRQELISNITWRVRSGEHWVLIGPNGAGKTTTLALAGAIRHPSSGTVRVLGHALGRVDMRALRSRIGHVAAGQRLADASATTVVLTGHTGTVIPLWDSYDETVRARAHELLDIMGCRHIADRPISVCSQGELGRIRIARALMADPDLLLLDEPSAGLDLPAREDLVEACVTLAGANPALTTVTVTHHVEEIAPSSTHAILMRRGRILVAGTVSDVLTDESMSECFERPLRMTRIDDRWTVHAVRSVLA